MNSHVKETLLAACYYGLKTERKGIYNEPFGRFYSQIDFSHGIIPVISAVAMIVRIRPLAIGVIAFGQFRDVGSFRGFYHQVNSLNGIKIVICPIIIVINFITDVNPSMVRGKDSNPGAVRSPMSMVTGLTGHVIMAVMVIILAAPDCNHGMPGWQNGNGPPIIGVIRWAIVMNHDSVLLGSVGFMFFLVPSIV
jgi:hypothetical protein